MTQDEVAATGMVTVILALAAVALYLIWDHRP